MWISLFERLVRISCRAAGIMVAVSVIVAASAGLYVSRHFVMDSNSENLISAKIAWRQHAAEFDKIFPQRRNLTLVVIDGVTPEISTQAANTLKAALAQHSDVFPIVRDIQGDPFFAHNGLLYSPLEDLRNTTQHIIAAEPFLAPLAADPSFRGIMDSLTTALSAVDIGQAKLDDLARPLSAISDTLEKIDAGQPGFFSWQGLVTGGQADPRSLRRLIEVQGVLDYSSLTPGAKASGILRQLAVDRGLTPDHGVRLRLTGPVPISDEEFGSLVDRVGLMAFLMSSAIVLMLFLAVRSVRIIGAILVTLFAGLAITMALGLAVLGRFNVISVAFIPLFVGIGVDFGIQYCVRYRAERYRLKDLNGALIEAGKSIGGSLSLAAAAIAACFYSFMPTDYSGLAELGFIAGSGMIIAFLLSGTMLPALLKILRPKGERAEIGYTFLAPLDRALSRWKYIVLSITGLLAVVAVALLPFLKFDSNPYDLRDARSESMATLSDLAKDPQTSPNNIDALAPSLAAADMLAQRLAKVPEVDKAMTLTSFIPDRQTEKIALISDAAMLMDPVLNPFEVKPAPTPAETMASIEATKAALLRVAGQSTDDGAKSARRLAAGLDRLEKAGGQTLTRAEDAFVPGLKIVFDQLRMALSPKLITLATLPDILKRDWLASDGRARVQVFPKGNIADSAVLDKFAAVVERVAPEATGGPIATRESGRTIVRAFIEAGILSFVAMLVLLSLALRNVRDIMMTVIPLVLIGVLTFGTCVAARLQLNFANIIVLPLLFGIGVAFNIYFVMSWRAGSDAFLQSSLTRAVILSALTTASGFGTLWLSNHPGMASMGALLTISLGWTLLITLFFVPALLECAPQDQA